MREEQGEAFGSLKHAALACGIVLCTFFYFLLFAQFALLHRIETLDAEKLWLQPVMILMGLGGLVGSGLGWKLFAVGRVRLLLALSFLGCAGLGFFAAVFERIEAFLLLGLLVGVFLGMLTVVVVPLLRLVIAVNRIGRWVGLATGMAYFLSNLPFVFQQSPEFQCSIAGGTGVVGVVLALLLPVGMNGSRLKADSVDDLSFSGRRAFGIVVGFLFVLVWLDSAAFYAIQESDALRDVTWGKASHLWWNGGVHLLLGILSGLLLERGKLLPVLVAAMGLLVGGCLWLRLGHEQMRWLGSGVYVAGVSLYSTALVAAVALAGETVGRWSVAKRAALLFAVAGWVGSGLGIGMARDLGTIPFAFLGIASGLAVAAWVLGKREWERVAA